MTRSREKFVVVRGGSGEWLRCRLVVVRGEISPAWAYVLRASLKTQSSFDIWDFEVFMPLAQRQLGRWIYSMALAPIMV